MSNPIKTGNAVKVSLTTAGKNCKVEVEGHALPGVKKVTIEAAADGFTHIAIDAFYPWPRALGKDGQVMCETFEGYFIERADWEAFDAWCKQKKKIKP